MSARSASNAAIPDRTLRRLRWAGRLDDLCEMLAVLAGTSARLVDAACAEAASLRVHAAVLSELSGRIAPVQTGEDDPWERIARALEATSTAAEEDDAMRFSEPDEQPAAHEAPTKGMRSPVSAQRPV
jgi:hypothetical protein